MDHQAGQFRIDAEKGVLVLMEEGGHEENFYIEEEVSLEGRRFLILCHEDEVDDGEYIAIELVEEPDGEAYLAVVDDEDEIAKIQAVLDTMDVDLDNE